MDLDLCLDQTQKQYWSDMFLSEQIVPVLYVSYEQIHKDRHICKYLLLLSLILAAGSSLRVGQWSISDITLRVTAILLKGPWARRSSPCITPLSSRHSTAGAMHTRWSRVSGRITPKDKLSDTLGFDFLSAMNLSLYECWCKMVNLQVIILNFALTFELQLPKRKRETCHQTLKWTKGCEAHPQ